MCLKILGFWLPIPNHSFSELDQCLMISMYYSKYHNYVKNHLKQLLYMYHLYSILLYPSFFNPRDLDCPDDKIQECPVMALVILENGSTWVALELAG